MAEAKVRLRVMGDELDPAYVTRALGIEPSSAWRKGELRAMPGGRVMPGRTGFWELELDVPATTPVNEQIARLLEQVPGDAAVWRALGERFVTDVRIGLFMIEPNEQIVLERPVIAGLGERGLEIDLDIYDVAE